MEKESGIVLAADKQYLVESRLHALCEREKQESIDKVLDLIKLHTNLALKIKVIEALTTNETSFFRDYRPFEFLIQDIFPKLIAARGKMPIRIWSAACSTGQEPYSIGIAILEAQEQNKNAPPITVIASDINEEVIKKAERGVYSDHEINRGLPAALLVKYFEQTERGWSVQKRVRDLIKFQKRNLLEAWDSSTACDVLFLRNVLIYFNVENKKVIFENIKRVLAKDGYLFLGTAETPTGICSGLKRIEPIAANCYQIEKK